MDPAKMGRWVKMADMAPKDSMPRQDWLIASEARDMAAMEAMEVTAAMAETAARAAREEQLKFIPLFTDLVR